MHRAARIVKLEAYLGSSWLANDPDQPNGVVTICPPVSAESSPTSVIMRRVCRPGKGPACIVQPRPLF